MVLLTKWLLLAPLLLASAATAQPQAVARQRQDRRATLPTTPAEPIPELYVAAGNLTTVAFNGPLDRDSLVVDRTRFKWVDIGDRLLTLQPFADLGSGERLIVKVGFKDRALPAQAVFAVVTDPQVMDGSVELDRRANTPEALLAALRQKEAELEDLKARYVDHGPASLVLSQWLTEDMKPVAFTWQAPPAELSGLDVWKASGYAGAGSALVAIRLHNLPGQKAWAVGQAHLTDATGAPVEVLSVQMKPAELSPGESGVVVVEARAAPWRGDKPFRMVLAGPNGQRSLALTLKVKSRRP